MTAPATCPATATPSPAPAPGSPAPTWPWASRSTATGSTFTFVPANANDGSLTTYWEGSAVYPQNLTVALGANHAITAVNVKLNPDPAWGTRTQNFQILGRDQASVVRTPA